MKKLILKNNETLVGNCVCYVYRGVAYNAHIIKVDTENENKMIIDFFTDNGKIEKSVNKNKLYTNSNLSIMKSVISDENFKIVDESFNEAARESIIPGEINIIPEKIKPETVKQVVTRRNKAKKPAPKMQKNYKGVPPTVSKVKTYTAKEFA
jgi:hypothetical protein